MFFITSRIGAASKLSIIFLPDTAEDGDRWPPPLPESKPLFLDCVIGAFEEEGETVTPGPGRAEDFSLKFTVLPLAPDIVTSSAKTETEPEMRTQKIMKEYF